jgi:Ca-activated chloride channel family protein
VTAPLALVFLAGNRLPLLLLLIPLAAVYIALQRRRRHAAVRFTNVRLLAAVAPRMPGWRRHVPAAAAVVALAALVFGLARPVVQRREPKDSAVVMLAIDVSASMNATDVSPNRITAAQSAAKTFVKGLPSGFHVGLIAFDRTATVLAPPTADHASVVQAIDRLTTGPGTAAGEAIYTALDSISAAGQAVANGKPAAIVLLSDGVTTVGRSVDEAAGAAAEARIPVTTIAFGTDEGAVNIEGRLYRVPADPTSMAKIADTTGGSFFQAVTSQELKKVYNAIGNRVGYRLVEHDISMQAVTLGIIVLMIAFFTALLWAPRML